MLNKKVDQEGLRFVPEEFNQFALDNDVVKFERGKSVVGRDLEWYADWCSVCDDVFLLDKLTDYVVEFARAHDLNPDCFYGVPEGATKLGLFAQYKWAQRQPAYGPHSHGLPMGRGKPKYHGLDKDKDFLGIPQGKMVLLDDATTTASSILREMASLSEVGGIEVIAVMALTNRMQRTPIPGLDPQRIVERYRALFEKATGKAHSGGLAVGAALKEAGIPYFCMSHAFGLLPAAYEKKRPGVDIAMAIEEEYKRFGIKEISLR